jgi:hypothetical protein
LSAKLGTGFFLSIFPLVYITFGVKDLKQEPNKEILLTPTIKLSYLHTYMYHTPPTTNSNRLENTKTWVSTAWCPAFFGFKGGRALACKCIPSPRAIEGIEKKHRHQRATHRPGKRYHPGYQYEVELSQFDLSTSNPDSSGACLQVSGKRGRNWVNSASKARAMRRTTTTTFDLPTTRLPDPQTR